jgi:hypothetical protein
MFYTFAVTYYDNLKHDLSGVPEIGSKDITVEEYRFESAIELVQNTLSLENKTLISLRLLNIEV